MKETLKMTSTTARWELSRILDRVLNGEHVILTRHNVPVAAIVPVSRPENRKRTNERKDDDRT